MKLTDLKKGDQGELTYVPLPRLEELGLIPGMLVTLRSAGPGGSPVEISCGGCDLLIDRKTAEQTEVKPCASFWQGSPTPEKPPFSTI